MKIVLAYSVTRPDAHMKSGAFIRPYISVKPKPYTKQLLTQFINSVESYIPNKLPPSEWHITVIYAMNECDVQEVRKAVVSSREYDVLVKKAELFTNEQEQTVHLVLRCASHDLSSFHQHLKQTLAIRTSFPDYKIHITISSNAHQMGSLSFEDCMDVYQRAADEMNEALTEADGLPLAFWKESVVPVNEDYDN